MSVSALPTHSVATRYTEHFAQSCRLYQESLQTFPSGVTHDSRYMEPFPVFVDHAQGSTKYSVEGHPIIDCWVGHGALLLGHSHPEIVKAVQEQMARGTHFSANHELELRWGQQVQKMIPSAERVRFTSSGTEATLLSLRIARMITGRSKIVKLIGHFHGWHDFLVPTAYAPYVGTDGAIPGISEGVLSDIVPVRPNDLDAMEEALAKHQPACVILEGTGGHWGAVPISGEYLHGVRELTQKYGVLLIMDEVISGFRVHPGGSQAHYGVLPDMTTLAKILAGGLPGGAIAGRADLLEGIAFKNAYGRKIPHPGTYNGNPLSAAAGIAALTQIAKGDDVAQVNRLAIDLRKGLNQLFQQKKANWIAYGSFSMIHILPEYDGLASTSDDFIPCNGDYLKLDGARSSVLKHAFRAALLMNGVDWFGWGGMLSSAHTEQDMGAIVQAFGGTIDLLREAGLML